MKNQTKMKNESPADWPGKRALFASVDNFIALGFGAGLSRIAPGTCGTLAAMPLYGALALCHPAVYLAVVAGAIIAGIRVCARAATALGRPDHPSIVWDEMVGLWIALCFIPLSWGAVIAGFILFRLFDIIKPWPINWLERRVGGGAGVMLDDVAAGVFANIALRFLSPYLPG